MEEDEKRREEKDELQGEKSKEVEGGKRGRRKRRADISVWRMNEAERRRKEEELCYWGFCPALILRLVSRN